MGDITYKFTRKFSVRAELQYLYTPDGPDGDWVAGLLELNIAPKWSIWGSDMYNYGGTEINYYSVGASFTHSFVRVALSWAATARATSVRAASAARCPPTRAATCR